MYIPLVAAVYDPKIAAATLLIIDFVCGVPFAIRALPSCRWFEILPLTMASALGIPLGAYALLQINAILMRWAVALFVFIVLAFLICGWRYRGRPAWWITWPTGFMSGFFGGAFQMDGPPVVIFWLGGSHNTKVVRANLMMFIALNGLMMCVVYWFADLLTLKVIFTSILLGVPFILAMILGARLFNEASERTYRAVAYALIIAAAIFSLPLWDSYSR